MPRSCNEKGKDLCSVVQGVDTRCTRDEPRPIHSYNLLKVALPTCVSSVGNGDGYTWTTFCIQCYSKGKRTLRPSWKGKDNTRYQKCPVLATRRERNYVLMSKGLIQDGDASLSRRQSLVHEKGEVLCAAGFGLCEILTSPWRDTHTQTHRSSYCREFLLFFV